MENQNVSKGNKICGHSVSCHEMSVAISQEVLHKNAVANAGDSKEDKIGSAATSNEIDMNPGSSRNLNDSLGTAIEEDENVNILPWFIRNADSLSLHSCESIVCRICHNSENPEKLVSPCMCKGSLTYVHIYCLERWISLSRCTTCELCQFQYNTQQTLRYSFLESLRIWYSRSMSRRALQEDCQMFSLLTLVAFGIIGTLMVAVQYYILQGHLSGIGRLWTKGWLIFFLLTTLIVYFINVYMIGKTQLTPWYRWWQSARDIRLVLENHKPFRCDQIKKDAARRFPIPTQAHLNPIPNQNPLITLMPQTSNGVPIVATSKNVRTPLPNNATSCPFSAKLMPQDNLPNATATSPATAVYNAAKTTMMPVMIQPASEEANYITVTEGLPNAAVTNVHLHNDADNNDVNAGNDDVPRSFE